MDPLFFDLLILMIVIWTVATTLRFVGLPTIMGELLRSGYFYATGDEGDTFRVGSASSSSNSLTSKAPR